ncbi:MAG: hypothetical protein WC250_01070 [Candidatus Paceibacterota bacterium]|jgi:glutathione synthase/RimK-type ligase-like ATP-grasp enzyme
MILILTKSYDPTADFVCEKAKMRGIGVHRVDLDSLPKEGTVSIMGNGSWAIDANTGKIDSREIKRVWQRRIPTIKMGFPDPEANEYAEKEWRLLFEWWINSLPDGRVLDPEHRLKFAYNKLLQLQCAKRVGLTVPDTLVTTDRVLVEQFYEKHGGMIVVKSLGGFGKVHTDRQEFEAIYTSQVTEKDLARLSELKCVPVVFQTCIEKLYEIRATVVGDQIFSCKIESQKSEKTKIDWRKYDFKNVPHTQIELPPAINEKILSVMSTFGIHFASFDLAFDQSGQYIFFEMNPNSQWVWIENLTGMPITEALLDYLNCD